MRPRTAGSPSDADLARERLGPRPAVAVHDEQYAFTWPFMTASLGVGVEL